MQQIAAVLTGDLIGSTLATRPAVDDAMSVIQAVASRIAKSTRFTRTPSISGFSRFRGDGWQLYLADPGLALATALLILAELRAKGGVESRIAIGLGDSSIDAALRDPRDLDLTAATGSAFVTSGRTLDSLKAPRRLGLAGMGVDRLHARLVSFLDDQAASWSKEQAEAVAVLLDPEGAWTQQQMADHFGISRQAIASRLKAANATAVNDATVDFYVHFSPESDRDA